MPSVEELEWIPDTLIPLMSLSDRFLLRKRAVAEFVRAGNPLMERTQAVETVIDRLKNISNSTD